MGGRRPSDDDDDLDSLLADITGGLDDFGADDDPFAEEEPDDIPRHGMLPDGRTSDEAAATRELNAFQRAARSTAARMEEENDGEFYAVVVFASRQQRDGFIHGLQVGWEDEVGMIDGIALARKLGVSLPPTPPPQRHRSGKKWAQLPAVRTLRPGAGE